MGVTERVALAREIRDQVKKLNALLAAAAEAGIYCLLNLNTGSPKATSVVLSATSDDRINVIQIDMNVPL